MTEEAKSTDRRARLGKRGAHKPGNMEGRGYSRFVKTLRIALPLGALAIIMILFFYPPEQTRIVPETPDEQEQDEGFRNRQMQQNELLNPTFESKTKEGRPYVITAAQALQKQDHPDLIYMDELTGRVEMDDQGREVSIRADHATYDQKTEFMTLSENIVVETDDGAKLFMSMLEADMNEGTAYSPNFTRGESEEGTVEGQSMRIKDQGGTIIFTGPAKLTLTNLQGDFR